MNIKKPLCALLTAGAMTFNLAAPALCEVNGPAAVQTVVREEKAADYREWQTDLRLSITRERDLRMQAGLTPAEWDARTAAAIKEGLGDPMTKSSLLDADADTQILSKDGTVYYVQGSKAFAPVGDAIDAYRTVYGMLSMLGGSRRTDLRLWSQLQENGRTIYSFQQIVGGETVPGSTIKLAVNADHTVSAVFSSLSGEQAERQQLATQAEAEEAVRTHMQEQDLQSDILSEKTDRIIHTPVTMDMLRIEEPEDDEEEEVIPDQVLWVVYTANEGEDADAYPYLAHYVKLDGTYDHSLPVKEPGDTDATDGFRKQPVFDGMEEGEWTGKVTDIAGEEHTITVPVMHSEKTGEWYLGDSDRHIAVADFSAAAYSDTHDLQLVSTKGNEGWDNEDLFMYYNYIRAWDFYADMGWIGPDGEGTDVIILKDLCLPDGTPYENACSIGKVENWQMFGYTGYSEMSGKSNGLVQALDVLAHEYTHTFTTTVMNANLYENDYGAINEAMSDIMGNITEYICHDTEDTRWLLGENTGSAIRSMSNPARYDQPAYVWDRCYGPHTDNPNDINDRGGVHANSSLLSRIAAGMCLNAGMSYEEAAAFWVTTACGMTPGMDYAQIGALLNWALQASGNNAYAPELTTLLKETKLDRTDVPDRLPYGQKLVKLILPDTEAFKDDHWVLLSLQPNINAVTEIGATAIETIVSLFRNKDKMEVLSKTVAGLTERLDLDKTKLDLKCLEGDDEEAILNVIGDVAGFAAGTIISQNVSWRAADTNEIITVMQDAPALHVLMRVGAQGTRLDNLLVLFQGHWFDLTATITDEFMQEGEEPDYEQLISTVADLAGEFLKAKLDKIGSGQDKEMPKKHKRLFSPSNLVYNACELVEYLTVEDRPESASGIFTTAATPEYLSTEGLEKVTLNTVK